MNIVLGFGCTEQQAEAAIIAALANASTDADVDAVLAQWNVKADEYDKMPRGTAPERYTRISFYGDALHFLHVNRRHALSPDGWAAMQTEIPFKLKGGSHE